MHTQIVASTTVIVDQSEFGSTEPTTEFLLALSNLISGFAEDFGIDFLCASYDAGESKLYLTFREPATARFVEKTFIDSWRDHFSHLDLPF